jgi:surface antigen
LGAILGGILGSQFGHGSGKTAATLGGVFLGGIAGNAIAGDIECQDRPYAFRAYSEGFQGPIGQHYEWYNDQRTSHGSFMPTREYRDRGLICRDFQEERDVRGRHLNRLGTACRENDGNWHFR